MLIPEKAYSLREAVLFFFTFKRYKAMRKGPFPNIFIYKLQWLLRYEVSLKMELSLFMITMSKSAFINNLKFKEQGTENK